MKKLVGAGVALAAAAMVGSIAVQPVQASPSSVQRHFSKSCSAGGFKGTIHVYTSPDLRQVQVVTYQINKGSNKGGNNANVWYTDTAVLPSKKLSTGAGYQTGNQHGLAGGNYYRGSGAINVKFTFDKSLAPDPSCSLSLTPKK